MAPPKFDPNDLAIDATNSIFGGTFTSHNNVKLREGKSWSYGARSLLLDAEDQRPFIVYAPVQTDKTAESMQKTISELQGDAGDDYYDTYAEAVRSLSFDKVSSAMHQVLRPDRLTWLVVADRETIEPTIRELGLGPIRLHDGNGQPTSPSP